MSNKKEYPLNTVQGIVDESLDVNNGKYTTKVTSEFLPVYLQASNDLEAEVHYTHVKETIYSVAITRRKSKP